MIAVLVVQIAAAVELAVVVVGVELDVEVEFVVVEEGEERDCLGLARTLLPSNFSCRVIERKK